jgi:O-antigen/teichoic acid export membrane protein
VIRAGLDLLRRYRHFNVAVIDQAMVSGVNFVVGIILARFLGAEEFGRYYFAWSVVLFAIGVHLAVISSPMMSIGPQVPAEEQPGYLGAVAVQQIALTAIVFGLLLPGLLIAAEFFPEMRLSPLALPAAAVTIALLTQEFLRRWFFTKLRAGAAFAVDAVAYPGQIAAILACYWLFNLKASSVLWSIAVAFLIAIAFGAILLRSRVSFFGATVRTVTVRHLRFSMWLIPGTILQWINSFASTFIVGALLGAAAVGGIRAGYLIVGVAHIFIIGLENFVPVRASVVFREHGLEAMTGFLKRITMFGTACLLILAIVIAVAPTFWVGLIFGADYVPYAEVVRIYAIMIVAAFPALPMRAGLRAIEQTRPIMYSDILSAAVTLIVTYPLVDHFGLIGAPIASIFVTSTYSFALFLFFVQRTRKLRQAAVATGP